MIEVDGCCGEKRCPFFEDEAGPWCRHPDAPDHGSTDLASVQRDEELRAIWYENEGAPPHPSWCPLVNAPALVTLIPRKPKE